ncbi:MAG: xanthine dehydrogenase family protein subunit M, partial [Acidimicrobiia bacterium]|nr:xanthine dehydrogenase family protein subunit M [Acidimicrobiia bacterium]
FLESVLAPDEMLTEVRVPVSTGGWAYEKFNRRAQDWAVVGVAVAEGGAGVALVNMGMTPLKATAVESAVAGGASPADAAAAAADGTEPSSDDNADADFRRHLARVLTQRALSTAQA